MARKLDGYDKAAILLMTLGEDTAAEIMKSLDPGDIRRIGGAISRLSDVFPEDVETVIHEFSEQVNKGAALGVEGGEYIQKVLTKALGQEKASRVIESLTKTKEDGLDALKWMDPKAISGIVRTEHPQTTALILIHLEPDQCAQVLRYLPEGLRSDVMLRMATLEEIPPGVMKEVNEVLQTELSRIGTTTGKRVGGVKLVANILNLMDPSLEQSILTSISQGQPELAEQIRQLMFVFEDLIRLDDRSMQALLKEVSKEQLALALRAAKEDLKEKIFKNMSERAAQILKEDMEVRGPVRLSEVEKAQQEIMKIAQKLAAEGQIVIGGKGETDTFI